MMSLTSTLTEALPGFGFLQSVSQGSAFKASATAQSSVSASNSSARLDDAEKALATLKQVASQSDRHAAVKAAATQKLALLKAQLKSLEMFGTDPKTKAQEAARIAREIGDAAKEYSQAGGSADAATATSSTAASPAAAPSVVPAVPSSADTGASTASTKTNPPAATIASAATPSNPAAKPATGTPSSGSTGQPSRSSSRSADLAFISEARLLARKANAILQAAIQDATRKKEQTSGLTRDGDKALTSIDIAAFSLGLTRGINGDTSAGYGASAQSVILPPAASIKFTA